MVVQERTGPASKTNLWKMPTGMVDEREDACDAAAREVLEETGVEVEVVQMVGMREAHNTRKNGHFFVTGRSNMFAVFLCRPKLDDPPIKAQATEIAQCKWMPQEE